MNSPLTPLPPHTATQPSWRGQFFFRLLTHGAVAVVAGLFGLIVAGAFQWR